MKLITKYFRTPGPLEVAARELQEAKLYLLRVEASGEYYNHMAVMYKERITRFEVKINEETPL